MLQQGPTRIVTIFEVVIIPQTVRGVSAVQEFEDIAGKKASALERTSRLEEQKALLQTRRDMIKEALAEKQQQAAGKSRQLAERPEYGAVQKLEARLRALATSNYALSEAIRAREAENNYKGLAVTLGSLAAELNGMVVQAVAASR